MDSANLPERLRELFHSNEPLSDEDIHQTQRVRHERQSSIENLRSKLADIEAQIREMRKQKGQLMNEIAQRKKDIRACDMLLSHARFLPAEILQLIFLYALPTEVSQRHQHWASKYVDNAPISLTQVCRHWRQVALGTPELWTLFSLRTFKTSMLQVRGDAFERMVKDYFSRAGDLPKSIDFHYGLGFTPSHMNTLLPCLFNSVLVENLTLSSPHLLDTNNALNAYNRNGRLTKRLTNLKSLVLRETASANRESTFTMPFPSNQRVLSNLTQLRRVEIEHSRSADLWAPALFDFDIDADRQGLPLPWNQLTHLSIVPWITYETWSQMFKSCTSLVRGTFYIVDGGETDDTGTNLIPLLPHSNLIDLTLIQKHFTSEPFVFEAYNFPSLISLRLGAYNQPHTAKAFDWSRIRTQIFNLTTLSLYHLTWEMAVSEIVQLFLATPNLLSLAMGVSTDYNAVFEHFQIDWNGHALLPKLKELTLDCVDARYKDLEDDTLAGTTTSRSESSRFLSLTADGFSEMVKDRWRPVEEIAQIERVSLFLPRTHEPMLEAVRHSLRREVKEGLHLTVQVSERPQWDDPLLGGLTHWDDM